MTSGTAGYMPQQGLIAGASKRLADADFSEPSQDTGEDHSAHAAGKTCKTCGHAIITGQDARLRGEADWVHDVCPIVPD